MAGSLLAVGHPLPPIFRQKDSPTRFGANFGLFSVVYNEVKRREGRNMTEKGYSATSVLRQDHWPNKTSLQLLLTADAYRATVLTSWHDDKSSALGST